MASNKETDGGAPEVKKGALDGAALKSGSRLRVGGGFRGYFRDAQFDDDGVSVEPVSAETAEALRAQFPKARVEEVKA